MKIEALVHVLVGVIALIGAVLMAYVLFIVGDAIGSLNAAGAAPGTDIASLQESARMLGGVVMVGWLWTVAVLISSVLTIRTGIEKMKKK